MSQCKGSCSCPKRQCNCARNFRQSKGINFKTPAENKETSTNDTKPSKLLLINVQCLPKQI